MYGFGTTVVVFWKLQQFVENVPFCMGWTFHYRSSFRAWTVCMGSWDYKQFG